MTGAAAPRPTGPMGVPTLAPSAAPAARPRTIAPEDLVYCADAIRHGSLSFHAASRLLPHSVRDPALALYAFCRLADDAVDLQDEKAAAVLSLRDRLDAVYAGRPRNAAPDRAFAAMVEAHDMPRALPEALLEGLAWDAMDRRYANISELRAYSARVASAVGAMMCVLMGVRDAQALARACDLGVAMQLTNIARDVGEDAREGRLYLPTDWLEEAGIDPARFLADPHPSRTIRSMVGRLVREADTLYARSEAGVAALPLACRPGIFAARYIYAGIAGRVRRAGHDSIGSRARTGTAAKLGWLALSAGRAAGTLVMPRSPLLYARPLPEVAFLVEAAAGKAPAQSGRAEALVALFAQLERRDRRRDTLNDGRQWAS
jgi:phytoene synthase